MSATERQQRWRNKMARTGMTRLDFYVPSHRADDVRAVMADLTKFPSMRLIGVRPVDADETRGSCFNQSDVDLPGFSQRDALKVAVDNLEAGELLALGNFARLLVLSRD